MEPSWVFYSGQPVTPLALTGGVVPPVQPGEPPGNAGVRNWQPKPKQNAWRFLAARPHHFVVTTGHVLKRIGSLPENVQVLGSVGYFLKNDALVLLGTAGRNGSRPVSSRREPEAS
jgi:hypothetical protein